MIAMLQGRVYRVLVFEERELVAAHLVIQQVGKVEVNWVVELVLLMVRTYSMPPLRVIKSKTSLINDDFLKKEARL